MIDRNHLSAINADARALRAVIVRMTLQFFLCGFISLSAIMLILLGIFGG